MIEELVLDHYGVIELQWQPTLDGSVTFVGIDNEEK